MPNWGWWAIALSFLFSWNSAWVGRGWPVDSWNRVLHRPLGDGYLIDIFAFLGIYALIRVVLSSIAHLRSLESQDKPDGQARLPDGAA